MNDGRWGWFGESWPSGICEDPDAEQLPTPAGLCGYCDEPFVEGEQGVVFLSGLAMHRECSLRSVGGSVAHLARRCSCFVPGSTENDPPDATLREGARAALAWVEEHGLS